MRGERLGSRRARRVRHLDGRRLLHARGRRGRLRRARRRRRLPRRHRRTAASPPPPPQPRWRSRVAPIARRWPRADSRGPTRARDDVRGGGCLLAVVSNTHRVTIHAPPIVETESEWRTIADLSNLDARAPVASATTSAARPALRGRPRNAFEPAASLARVSHTASLAAQLARASTLPSLPPAMRLSLPAPPRRFARRSTADIRRDVRRDLERLRVPQAPGERRARRGRRRGNSTRRSGGGVAPGRRPTNHRDGRVSRPSRVRRRSRRRRRGGMDRLRPGAPRTRRRSRRNRDRNRDRNRVFLPRGARASVRLVRTSTREGARAPARRTFVVRDGPDARGGAHLALARVGPGEDGVRERGARGRVGRGRARGSSRRAATPARIRARAALIGGRRSRMVVRDPGRLRGRARGGLRVRRRGGE